jgi:galactonate dehydratase
VKIAKIEQFFPRQRMRLVKITTDNGIVGWGETTLEGKPKSTWAAVEELAEYFVGKDPLRIEHHWQHVYRSAFFRGGNVLMSALSGIDQALWDIAGKYYDVPAYMLLGGAVRDRIRVYAHWGVHGQTDEALASARARLDMLLAKGYTAFKTGPGGTWRAHEPPARIDAFVKDAYTMREWVGDEVELCFDFHGKMTPGLAIEVCGQLAGMRPMFVEEPIPQENVDALKEVSDHVPFPIATGERLLSRWEFREIFEKQAVSYIQPDGSHAGGITELKKIANMAEAYYIPVSPHDTQGPINILAGAHTMTAVPNFYQLEFANVNLENYNACIDPPLDIQDGHIILSDRPGLGHDLNMDYIREHPDIPSKGYGIGWFDTTEPE